MILPPTNASVCGRVRARMGIGPDPQAAKGSQHPGSPCVRITSVPPFTGGSGAACRPDRAALFELEPPQAAVNNATSSADTLSALVMLRP